jgi:ribosomal protein L19
MSSRRIITSVSLFVALGREPASGVKVAQILEKMVARDGVEPPTPAFSELISSVAMLLI